MELVDHLSRLQYIDGAWVESSNKQTREIINPYNQAVILEVAEGTAEDSERAILAAFMVGNPLRSAKTSSINRNFMTRETTSSGGTLYFPTNPVQPNCSRVFICP